MATTILSRAWRGVWIGLPSLTFDKSLFYKTLGVAQLHALPDSQKQQLKLEFLDFVDRILTERSKKSEINTLSLDIYVPNWSTPAALSSRLDRWISSAINDFKVEELIFKKASLLGAPFRFVSNGYVPLKRLELARVTLGPEMIECLSRNCPLIERLCFRDCDKLGKLTKISGFGKLLELVLQYENSCSSKLEISAPNLRFLEYNNTSNSKIKDIEADSCYSSLRDLRLCNVILRSNWPFSLISNLELKMCYFDTRDVVISSDCLETLSIWNCMYSPLIRVKVEATSLKYFGFSGVLPSFFEFYHSGLEKAKIQWYTNSWEAARDQFVGFLAMINPCKELELEKYAFVKEMFESEWRQNWNISPLPDVKHLKLEFHSESWFNARSRLSIKKFVDTLLWLSPCPLTVTVSLYSYKEEEFKVLKFKYYKEGNKGTKKCSKCDSLPVRCWPHRLKEVSIENHRAHASELAYEKRRNIREVDDKNIKAFFKNARKKEPIIVNIIS